jgi:hypothetical protein
MIRNPFKRVKLEHIDSNTFFGLSHANFLVLPRIALQSMPLEWQYKFFALVEELQDSIEMPEGYTGNFAVTMRNKENGQYIKNVLPHYRHNTLPYKKDRKVS